MDIKNFQIKKNQADNVVFSGKDMGYKYQGSGVAKQLEGNEAISKILNTPEKKREFDKIMAEQSGGFAKNVMKDDLRETLGYIKSGKAKFINRGAANELGNVFSGALAGRKFIMPKEKSAPDRLSTLKAKMAEERKNNPVVSPKGESSPITKPGHSEGGSVAKHSRLF